MASPENTSTKVVILPPDKSLLNKLGGASLDKIISPQNVAKAEAAITSASDELYLDCIAESSKLQALVSQFRMDWPNAGPRFNKIISIAFGIKNKASQSGYSLIAALAESLQTQCEKVTPENPMTPSFIKLVIWHAQSIAHLLAKKVKADGGAIGKAIMAEIQKIRA